MTKSELHWLKLIFVPLPLNPSARILNYLLDCIQQLIVTLKTLFNKYNYQLKVTNRSRATYAINTVFFLIKNSTKYKSNKYPFLLACSRVNSEAANFHNSTTGSQSLSRLWLSSLPFPSLSFPPFSLLLFTHSTHSILDSWIGLVQGFGSFHSVIQHSVQSHSIQFHLSRYLISLLIPFPIPTVSYFLYNALMIFLLLYLQSLHVHSYPTTQPPYCMFY